MQRREPIVSIEEEQPIAAGQAEAGVAGSAHAHLRLTHKAEAGVALDKARGESRCSVTRAVIDDDRLPALEGLGVEGLERFGECCCRVMSRYDDRYLHANPVRDCHVSDASCYIESFVHLFIFSLIQ